MHNFVQELKRFVGNCDGLRSYQVAFKTNFAKVLERIGSWYDVMLDLTPCSLHNDIQRTKDFLSKVELDFDKMTVGGQSKTDGGNGGGALWAIQLRHTLQ